MLSASDLAGVVGRRQVALRLATLILLGLLVALADQAELLRDGPLALLDLLRMLFQVARALISPGQPGFHRGVLGSQARMSVFTDVKSRATGLARAQKKRYSGDEERPLGGYLIAMGAYAAVTGALALTARLTRRPVPDGLSLGDVLLSAVATHKLSRLITKDPVTSPLRAPFTRYQGQSGPAELKEQARGTGARKTVGELITCPFCIDMWVATGLVAGFVFLPRTTRLAADTLTVLAGADLLQFGYSLVEEKEQS